MLTVPRMTICRTVLWSDSRLLLSSRSRFDAPQACRKFLKRSPFFNRGGFCKENLHALSIFSFFVRLEVPFLRPGLQLPERCAQRKASPSCPKGAERVARACAPGPSQAGLAGASTALCSAQGGTFSRCPVPGHGSFRGRHGSPQLGVRGWRRYVPNAVTKSGAATGNARSPSRVPARDRFPLNLGHVAWSVVHAELVMQRLLHRC
jgi:hypothetical protein